ncbi:variable surface lipoprotein [Mycoplasma sp. 005V]|uniref:variable surface lipoprotein n=1 Tax=Mycoplasma sp. 005V TaxID=3398776 RepID=UPI003A8C014E
MKRINKLFITLGSIATTSILPLVAMSCVNENKDDKNPNDKGETDKKVNPEIKENTIPEFKSKFEFRKYIGDNITKPLYTMIKNFQPGGHVDVAKIQNMAKLYVELLKNKEYGVSQDELNNFTTGFSFKSSYNKENYSPAMVQELKEQGMWETPHFWEEGDFDKIFLPIANGENKNIDFLTLNIIDNFIAESRIHFSI